MYRSWTHHGRAEGALRMLSITPEFSLASLSRRSYTAAKGDPAMFLSAKHYRSFLTVVMTYTLDLIGYSIVFPVLAPLLLDAGLHFFAPGTPLELKTTVLGLLFASFGLAQFFGASLIGVLADHYGRKSAFLLTIGLSVLGYIVMALGIYWQQLDALFVGRIVTGLCSGNFPLAQAATADLTEEKYRSQAFGILIGVGGLGFVAGPWFGGKLAHPDWLGGSAAFIFAAAAALLNLLMVLFFYTDMWKRSGKEAKSSFWHTFRDLRHVFRQSVLRQVLTAQLLFSIGWAFFLTFSPTFLVQKFALAPNQIGDIYAYQSICWFFVAMFLNKELTGRFSLYHLSLVGMFLGALGMVLFVVPDHLWFYWVVVPIGLAGGALAWVNVGSILSLRATPAMQGRAMGAGGSMWSIGQMVAPLLAGPLSGWSMYAPLLVGSGIIGMALVYFAVAYREKT